MIPKDNTTVHQVYFKSMLGGNGDPTWHTWSKANFTAPLYHCVDQKCQLCPGGKGCDYITFNNPTCLQLCNTTSTGADNIVHE